MKNIENLIDPKWYRGGGGGGGWNPSLMVFPPLCPEGLALKS